MEKYKENINCENAIVEVEQTNNRIREEFEEYLLNNWEDRENLPVADWWLSKIDELLKSQRVEHCSEPKCPECNLVAYQKGREDAKKELEEAHKTKDGFCCACEYDIAVLEGKLKAQREKVIHDYQTNFEQKHIASALEVDRKVHREELVEKGNRLKIKANPPAIKDYEARRHNQVITDYQNLIKDK